MTWQLWAIVALIVIAGLVAWLVCAMAQTFITKPDELRVPPREKR